jgi:hypothetical protein
MVTANKTAKASFTAKVLPLIDEIRSAGVQGLQGIADCLDRRGIPTRSGKTWYPSAARNVLQGGCAVKWCIIRRVPFKWPIKAYGVCFSPLVCEPFWKLCQPIPSRFYVNLGDRLLFAHRFLSQPILPKLYSGELQLPANSARESRTPYSRAAVPVSAPDVARPVFRAGGVSTYPRPRRTTGRPLPARSSA